MSVTVLRSTPVARPAIARRFVRGLVAAALLALAPLAAPAQEVSQSFTRALDLCLDSFPNLSQARIGAQAAGFRSEGRGGGLDIFTSDRRRVLTAYQVGSDPACVVGLNGLYGEAAVQVAQAALAARVGEQMLTMGPSTDGRHLQGWIVAGPAGGLFVSVTRQTNLRTYFSGSLIVVQAADVTP